MRTYNNLAPVEKRKEFTDLRDLYKSSAEKYGDKVQYYFKEDGLLKEFTFNDFWQSMREFSTALYEKELNTARIAVVGDTHPYWMVAFASVFSCGGVIVPLDRELDDSEMIKFMKKAKCTAVVYTGSMMSEFLNTVVISAL